MIIMYPIDNKEGKLCDHGCGQIAKFKNASGKLCCCESFYQCPGYKKHQCNDAKKRPPVIKKGTRLKDKSGICEICGKIHDGRYGSGRYCSSECAHKASIIHTDKLLVNKKKSEAIKKKTDFEIFQISLKAAITYNKNHPYNQIQLPSFGESSNRNTKCRICGQIVCNDKEKCIKMQKMNFKIFESIIDITKLGSIEIYDEYDKLKKWLYDEYVNNKKSALDIQKELHIKNFVSVYLLLQKFNIPKRTPSQCAINTMMQKPDSFKDFHPCMYHCGYHTSWEGKKFWYRSSYELDYAKILDENRIHYDVESIKLLYWRSSKNRIGILKTDFYIPDINLIVEVKSDFTYNEQDWKDRVSLLESKGYKCMLLLEHEWFDTNHIPKQRMEKIIDNYWD